MRLTSPGLALVAQTLALAEAELSSPAALADLLQVRAPEAWPPGEYDREALLFFCDSLRRNPALAGWLSWYALLPGPPATLFGAGGYFGPPDAAGAVEIGLSVLPAFRRRGLGIAIARLLLSRAWSFAQVRLIQARTSPDNTASQALLRKAGLRLAGTDADGLLRFEAPRPLDPAT
jgi:RimJ/RimL family protein N-acetyltransferase